MPAAFQLNIGCLSTGLPDLGVACIGLVLLTGLSSLSVIIAALEGSSLILFSPCHAVFIMPIFSCFS